nr:putative mitochondrial carrier c29a3.11c [Quercus suber]
MSSSDGTQPSSSPNNKQPSKAPANLHDALKQKPAGTDSNTTTTTTSSSSSSSSSSSNTNKKKSNNELNKIAKDWRTQIAAGSSSMLSTFATFPLDLAKSRMQSYNTGFVHTIGDVYKAEGFRAFWKGVLPPMCSVTIVRIVSFSLYQKTKYAYDGYLTRMTGLSPLAIANAPGSMPTLSTIACFSTAGATSGAILTTISCPFELTKLSEQLAGKMAREPGGSGSTKGTGAWATARRLYAQRGVTGLYAGYRLHLLRDTVGTAIYFGIYESIKQMMANGRGNEPASPLAVLVAGGMCGITSWALIYPIDAAKTKYQKELLSTGFAPRPKINFLAFESFRGLGVSCIRSAIVNMIFFSSFEFWKKYINQLPTDEDPELRE